MYASMHDPSPASVSLGGAATTATNGFLPRYGIVFVWHAISAVLAWCFLAPLTFAWLRVVRRAGNNDAHVRYYRAGLFATVVLTVQAWLVAVTKEHNTPPAHGLLGSGVLLIIVVHAVWHSMKKAIPDDVFEQGTNIFSAVGIGIAGYTCHHSVYVFNVPWIPAAAIHTLLGLSLAAIVFATLGPVSACKRISGIRPGYFEQGNDHSNHMSALSLNISKALTPHLGFRVVEDDGHNDDAEDDVDEELREEQTLSLVTSGDQDTHIPTIPQPNTQQRADT